MTIFFKKCFFGPFYPQNFPHDSVLTSFFFFVTRYHYVKFEEKGNEWIPSNPGFRRVDAQTVKHEFIGPFPLKS